MGLLGAPAGPFNNFDLCRALRPIYSTTVVSFNRFLRAVVCEGSDSAYRSQEGCQVRTRALRWSLLFIYVHSKTSVYFVCSGCQSFYDQPLGRMTERVNDHSGNTTILYKTHVGPTVSEKCPECRSPLHIAGPMWNGPIHDSHFVGRILEHLAGNEDKYGTATRMKGMLTVAKEVGFLVTLSVTPAPRAHRGHKKRS